MGWDLGVWVLWFLINVGKFLRPLRIIYIGADMILTVGGKRSFCKNLIVVWSVQKSRSISQSIKWKECRTQNVKEMERTNNNGMGEGLLHTHSFLNQVSSSSKIPSSYICLLIPWPGRITIEMRMFTTTLIVVRIVVGDSGGRGIQIYTQHSMLSHYLSH